MIALIGAICQIGYGLLAVMQPWPAILNPGAEGLWIVVNIGMIAGLVGWAGVVAPGRTVTVGAVTASAGFLLRIVAALISVVEPSAEVLALVLGSIGLTLAGIAVVAVGSFLVRSPRSGVAWVPALGFAVELGLASMYSAATELHFMLLGLLWGLVSLSIAVLVLTCSRSTADAVIVGNRATAAHREERNARA
ncbi:hypothetical protein P0L94_08055 [Microbacter sp. GSS18]|nr:hypothetical protein P0L94_08055 [Microbacter sp. GSS18]